VLSPWTNTQLYARLKVGLSDASFPKISCSFLLLPRCCRLPVCRMRECVLCRFAFLSWRQRGHGGGCGRRLGHRAATPQLRGGRPPPAPQCPMASRSQLLCCPSNLTSPTSPICWQCSKGGEQRHTAQEMADATANLFGCCFMASAIIPTCECFCTRLSRFWEPHIFVSISKPHSPHWTPKTGFYLHVTKMAFALVLQTILWHCLVWLENIWEHALVYTYV